MAITSAPPPPPSLLLLNGLLILLFLSIPFLALRILFLLPPLRPPPRPRRRPGAPPPSKKLGSPNDSDSDSNTDSSSSSDSLSALPNPPTHLLIVLGSGGHTAEMLAMLSRHPPALFLRSYSRRTYVVSAGDALSAGRARDFEESLHNRIAAAAKAGGGGEEEEGEGGAPPPPPAGTYTIATLPRARHIHQPLLTTPPTALRTLVAALRLLWASPPDLILTNGPGTGVVVVGAAVVLRVADLGDAWGTSRMRSVYVESWARVRGLSLSGWVAGRVVDRLVVQWEGLAKGKKEGGGRGEFLGVLV